MMTTSDVAVCLTCEIEVPWPPVLRDGRSYCCEGCAVGGPCSCSYDLPAESSGDGAAVVTAVGARRARKAPVPSRARRHRAPPREMF
jgi:hypothetical protein